MSAQNFHHATVESGCNGTTNLADNAAMFHQCSHQQHRNLAQCTGPAANTHRDAMLMDAQSTTTVTWCASMQGRGQRGFSGWPQHSSSSSTVQHMMHDRASDNTARIQLMPWAAPTPHGFPGSPVQLLVVMTTSPQPVVNNTP